MLECSLALEELALRCGQHGAMNYLEHFITMQAARDRSPVLLLCRTADQELDWAVLIYELAPLGLRTGIYTTDEISGYRTVIATPRARAAAASAAATALLAEGAQAILISCLTHDNDVDFALPKTVPACHWAVRQRTVVRTLIVRDRTYKTMLKSLGKATRFNLGYYRRRLARRMHCEFVADARGMFSPAEIEALNASSLNPFKPELAKQQYANACRARGGFLVGLRNGDGLWLSLVGGWRQAQTTVLLWQMNRAGFERDSLGIVMRGYFLEHEINCGAQEIIFYGGTPNSIEHSFAQETATDLIILRRSLRSTAIAAVAWFFGRPHWWKKVPSFFAASLSGPKLYWHKEAGHSK